MRWLLFAYWVGTGFIELNLRVHHNEIAYSFYMRDYFPKNKNGMHKALVYMSPLSS
jgi:hypothetical protein